MTASAVVLLSGGLDSATAAALARQQNLDLIALTVNYGQRHAAEIDAASRVATYLKARHHAVLTIPSWGGSALNDDIDVPKGRSVDDMGEGIPETYVPARNTVLLAHATALAEVSGSDHIFIGVNALDYSGYPDCRPAFITRYNALMTTATKAGVEGRPITVHAPLLYLTKAQIIRTGIDLGLDYSLTLSCYDPISTTDGWLSCGQCDSCTLRRKGFQEASVPDPTRYVDGVPDMVS